MSTRLPEEIVPDNDQTRARGEHLERIRALVGNAYPNRFVRTALAPAAEGEDTITSVVGAFAGRAPELKEGERPTPEQLEEANEGLAEARVRVSGRLATPPRVMGKAAFVHLSDGRERLQVYVRRQEAVAISNDSLRPAEEPESGWKLFQLLDHGDFVGVEGRLFVTKTGELSVHVETIQFLSKALLPMPDKLHGISDPEIRQRQRYADLIASSLKVKTGDEAEGAAAAGLSTREVFERRSKLISSMRRHLDEHGYIEVETPMLSPIASGAAARPFTTHHNALDIDLYLRIAPELYLKRLLVGGFERVYELNRNFRNEGISTRHNPEFTMLEFYTAYKDVNWMMDFCEEMLRGSIQTVHGGTTLSFGEQEFDFGRGFRRLTMREAVAEYVPEDVKNIGDDGLAAGRLVELFEQFAEHNLIQPTFITDFPKSVSPLSKGSPDDPAVAERFELYVAGMEVANGFSELNDPAEQLERFEEQSRQREGGDEEAMQTDLDYVRALSYGMPPAAGIGIGIDRLTMLLTDRRSIRDVILFPHMRPRHTAEEQPPQADEAEPADS
jgi:lysyl-tRNA synthetase class 2